MRAYIRNLRLMVGGDVGVTDLLNVHMLHLLLIENFIKQLLQSKQCVIIKY